MMSRFQFDLEEQAGVPIVSNPSQPVNLRPTESIAGVQIRQLQVSTTQPAPKQTPINIQTRVMAGGQRSVTVQFLRDPSDSNFINASAVIKTPQGTQSVQASSSAGAMTFTSPASTAPSSLIVRTNTAIGSTSDDFGSASSNKLNRK